MLELRKIVNETDAVRAALDKRGEVDPPIDEIIALDVRRRELIRGDRRGAATSQRSV